MKLQVFLYHTHTHQTMLTPTLTTLSQIHLIPVHTNTDTLYITREPPEHTIALFSSKCVYFVSPGYMFMWFHPEFEYLQQFTAYMALVWCVGVSPLPTEHVAAT